MTQGRTVALLMPAAGEGRRLGLDVPKALADIDGLPMVHRALEPFGRIENLVEIVVLAPGTAHDAFVAALSKRPGATVIPRVVVGGATRQQSVKLGLGALRTSPDLICVHDAARPLVTTALIAAVVARAASHGAAIAAACPVDSVRQEIGGGMTRALDRSSLWLVQTPQVFSAKLLRDAHRKAETQNLSATDDASLVERVCDARIAVVSNDSPNLKVTTASDLEFVRALFR